MSGKAATAAVKTIAKKPIQLTLRPRDVAFAMIGAVGTFLFEPTKLLKEAIR